jgi:predicted nucleic acid-binding protein
MPVVMAEALDIAMPHSITVYDTAHVAWLNLPLITADQPLIRTLTGTIFAVLWPEDALQHQA